MGKTKRGKGTKLMAVADGHGLPLAVYAASASPHEVSPGGCHASLEVWELVPARLKVTEHRLAVLRCPSGGRTTSGEFAGAVRSGVRYGPGVKARVLYHQQWV